MPFIGTFFEADGASQIQSHRSGSHGCARRRSWKNFCATANLFFVFPEGTFTGEDGVRPFQLGAFKAAVATGVPIIPVSLAGTRRFLRDGTYLPRPTDVTITIHPPIYPQVASNASDHAESSGWHELIRLRDATREAIGQDSGEPIL